MRVMRKYSVLKISVLGAALTLAAACTKDPGAGKSAAEVKKAEPDKPAAAAAGEKQEKLTFEASSASVGFVGAKVTAQHPGSFTDFHGEIDLVNADPAKS